MTTFRLSDLVANPQRGLAALCLAQIAFWTLAPTLSYDAPPYDVVENQVWGAEWVFGTYKHPNFPGWLLEISRRLTGAIGWPAYLMSQIAITATFVFVYLLGRGPLGERGALAGALLLTFNYYFGWHTPEFNHDILLMPLWAAVALSLWRAVETGKTAWWIALGLTAALGLYAKLAAGIELICAALWILGDAKARARLAARGPWIALAVFFGCVSPLAFWMLKSHFSGLAYAVHRGHGHGKSSLTFIALESGIAATAFTVLACARTGADEKAGHATEIKPDQRFMWFLAMMTLGPLMLTALLAAINHTGARLMWGVPMLSFTGLLAVALLAPNLNAPTLKRLLAATAAVLIILPVAHALTTYAWPAISKKPRRENWPQAEISAALRKAYEDEVGRPPTIIAGEIGNWLSGLVAVSGTKMLPVYTNADQALSPWITPDRLATEGALVVWDEHNGGPGNLETLIGSNERHVMTFAIPRAGSGKPAISAGYAIVRPQK